MKNRSGFVSNSSSSSFVIFSSSYDGFWDITEKDVDSGMVYCTGSWHGEGVDFFVIDKPIYKFLLSMYTDLGTVDGLSFEKVYFKNDSDSKKYFSKKEIFELMDEIPEKDGINISSVKADFYSCSSVKDVRDNYFTDVELEGEQNDAKEYINLERQLEEQRKKASEQNTLVDEIAKKMKEISKKVNRKIVNKLKEKI